MATHSAHVFGQAMSSAQKPDEVPEHGAGYRVFDSLQMMLPFQKRVAAGTAIFHEAGSFADGAHAMTKNAAPVSGTLPK